MASPHASSFLCLPSATDGGETREAYEHYYYVCLGSAAIGAVGAVVFFCQLFCGSVRNMISKSQKNVLVNLAISDFLADIGVMARSVYYLFFWERWHIEDTDFRDYLWSTVGGTVIESWISFWYIASYFWTFHFAVDIYSAKHNGRWNTCCSHTVTWFYSFVLVALSCYSLWGCKPYYECTFEVFCIVSHFMCTYGPIVIFMVALPLFYGSILRKMERSYREGLAIEVQRREKQKAKKKVFIFILVFYICWFVNVLDGGLLIAAHVLNATEWPKLYQILYHPHYIHSVWILEAILNPLQGLLNAIAYGNLFESILNCYGSIKRRVEDSVRFNSWSGEFIDVDFRQGNRGSIGTAGRKFMQSH